MTVEEKLRYVTEVLEDTLVDRISENGRLEHAITKLEVAVAVLREKCDESSDSEEVCQMCTQERVPSAC